MSTSLAFDIIARDRASSTFDKVGNSADGAGSKLKKFGTVAAAGLAVAGTALIAGGKYAFEHGAMLEQMDMKAKTVFGGQIGSVNKWADSNARAMGLSSMEATGLAANFADLLIPMGFARDEAAKMATKVVGLSGALSQWSGGTKSTAEVTEILNAAMLGETDGLKALGISISAADVEAQLAAKGQAKLTGAAKQQAEAQAIQTLIFQKSTDAQKAFAAGGSPLLSAQAKLKGMFAQVRDEMVMKLVPVMGKLADFALNRLAPALAQVGDWIKTRVLPALRDFAQDVAPKARDIMDKIKKAFQDARPFLELMGKALTNFVLPALGKLMKLNLTVLGMQIEYAGDALGKLGKAATAAWNNVLQPVFKFFLNAIGDILQGLGQMFAALGKVPKMGWAKDAAASLDNAANKAREFATGIAKIPARKEVHVVTYHEAIYQVSKGAGGAGKAGSGSSRIGSPLSRAVPGVPTREEVETAFQRATKAAGEGGKKLSDKIKEKFSGLVSAWRSTFETLKSDMASLAESVGSAFNSDMFGFEDIAAEIDEATGAVIKPAQSALSQMFAGLTGTGSNLSAMLSAFDKLKGMGASSGFLTQLFQSGNAALASQLVAAGPGAVQQASGLFGSNAAMADKLGDKVAVNEYGPKAAAQMTRLEDLMRDAPRKYARELREVLKGMELVVSGTDAGRKAYLRGGR